MIYALSFVVLLSPLLVVAVVTSRLTLRAKIQVSVAAVAVLLILPIAVFWLYGG